MGFLQIIIMILKYGPAVFELISELWDLIKRIRGDKGKVSEAEAKRDLRDALQKYRRTGDRGPLRRLRDRLRKDCQFE